MTTQSAKQARNISRLSFDAIEKIIATLDEELGERSPKALRIASRIHSALSIAFSGATRREAQLNCITQAVVDHYRN